ncbi:site-2 protease family protein [Paenibacillus sp. GCM10023248]|uniref:site-2 protease family protein n=1 Tax=unclassified Paenibacillus TaxID=185978 RepID=UPI0023786273|nr:site-2 protease family protein [Paenibacillus sp. MAHUQ-63]MDD9267585.1 site-2 protease family protein [Paenibacillus sp. MAHUQ-63]
MLSYYHLETLLPRLLAFLIAMTLHDAAHAGLAKLLGDSSARNNKRLSLNPLVHLDTLGLAMIVFGPYGWSKPMPVNASNFKRKPKLSHTLVYIAGPLTNLLLALFFWWLYFFLPSFVQGDASESIVVEQWRVYLQYGVIVNIMLAVIHMVPLYPLDGWHIVQGLVPPKQQRWMDRNKRYALILVIVLLITPAGQWALEHVYPLAAQLVMNLFSI